MSVSARVFARWFTACTKYGRRVPASWTCVNGHTYEEPLKQEGQHGACPRCGDVRAALTQGVADERMATD